MASLKVRPKPKVFKESGSPFDATDFDSITTKPGGHETVPKPGTDVAAFSHSKTISKPSPSMHLKAYWHRGNVVTQAEIGTDCF